METHGLKNPERYSYELMRRKIYNCQTLKNQALLCLLYGAGVRISELNQINAEDVQDTEMKGKKILRIYTPTLKNRKTHDRFIYILYEKEDWLAIPIKKYAELSNGIMFPYHRSTLYRWAYDLTGINPHGFRKIRSCHLVTEYNWTDRQLVSFMGWSDSRPAEYYIRLRASDLVPGLE